MGIRTDLRAQDIHKIVDSFNDQHGLAKYSPDLFLSMKSKQMHTTSIFLAILTALRQRIYKILKGIYKVGFLIAILMT